MILKSFFILITVRNWPDFDAPLIEQFIISTHQFYSWQLEVPENRTQPFFLGPDLNFFFSNNFSKISLVSFIFSQKGQNIDYKKRSQVFDFDTNYLLFCYFFSGDFWRECVALFSDLFLLSHGNIAFRRAKIERRAHLQSLFFRYHALLSPTLSVSH